MAFHVLNRGVGKNQLFSNDEDFLAFERIIADTLQKRTMRILSYCLLPKPYLVQFFQLPLLDGLSRRSYNGHMFRYFVCLNACVAAEQFRSALRRELEK